MAILHDTELCADETGCDQSADSKSLCHSHYKKAKAKNDLTPSFRSLLVNRHSLGDMRSDGKFFCSACNDYVKATSHNNGSFGCSEIRGQKARFTQTGWTQEEYDFAVMLQGNRCAICGDPPSQGTVLNADHCHNRNIKRALLCTLCNKGLGQFLDSTAILEKALDYLRKEWQS